MSVYLDAIKVLEERGWHQGGYESNDGAVCIFGALNCAIGVGVDDIDSMLYFNELLTQLTGLERVGGDFNDALSTSYEDVVTLLKRAHEATS